MDGLTEKTVVITGAAKGIGAALADEAFRRGMNVVASDVNADELERFVTSRESDRIIGFPADVSSDRDVQALADFAFQRFDTVDYLFNNAGICIYKKIYEHMPAEFEAMLNVNLIGIVNGVSAFLPRMREQGRSAFIVNTASVAGLLLNPGLNGYGVTKHAVIAYSQALALEFAVDNIDVKAAVICPGSVDTELLRSVDAMQAAVDGGADFGAIISPTDVARMTFEQIDEGRFFIITHSQYNFLIKDRAENVVAELLRS